MGQYQPGSTPQLLEQPSSLSVLCVQMCVRNATRSRPASSLPKPVSQFHAHGRLTWASSFARTEPMAACDPQPAISALAGIEDTAHEKDGAGGLVTQKIEEGTGRVDP